MRTRFGVSLCVLTMLASWQARADIPRTIPFQISLHSPDGAPVNGTLNLTLNLYDISPTPNLLWSESKTVTVVNGMVLTTIGDTVPFPASLKFDAPYVVGVQAGSDAEMTPRIPLGAVPYALNALNCWSLSGNGGTTVGTHFIGTTDNQALEMKVNGSRAMRLEPTSAAPNVIGGLFTNAVKSGATGAFLGGGGIPGSGGSNAVYDSYGVVSGGTTNKAGTNDADTGNATYATVAGGTGNTASGTQSSVGGGAGNFASGLNATVPGGFSNTASGQFSFAAGRRARANHDGTLVWGDSTNADIASTAPNQFLVRAAGGVGINVTDPVGALTIGGDIWMRGGLLHFQDLSTQSTAGLVPGTVAGGDLAGTYPNPSISANAVTTSDIADGAVVNAKIASGISYSKLVGAPSSLPPAGPASGDLIGQYPSPSIKDGAVTAAKLAPGAANAWNLTGNTGTTGVNFVGTTDNTALEFRVNGQRALRIVPTDEAPNIIGGYYGNGVSPGIVNATIAGGGAPGGVNVVYDDYGAIGGGGANQAGSADAEVSNDGFATIAGGRYNVARFYSAVGGGLNNQATGQYASVNGGGGNTASGRYASVGGGYANTASGQSATVPGGIDNTASGDSSLAAGQYAYATHPGSFVWSDGTGSLASYANYSFTVRAVGGARFYTNAAHTTGVSLPAGGGAWGTLSDRNLKRNLQPVNPESILKLVSELPVSTWNYVSQPDNLRHIGPMAQDFAAAFGVGENDTHISTIDADGVSLAAIQGLYQLVRSKDTRIAELEKQMKAQSERNAELESRLSRLEAVISTH